MILDNKTVCFEGVWLFDGAETFAFGPSRRVKDLCALTGAHFGPIHATTYSVIDVHVDFARGTLTLFILN